jgi:predicted N-acetyltransferase YhbS
MIITTPKTKEEFEQIHKLNYDTFVEEIPQHNERKDKTLIDKYHDKNNYLVAKKDDEVVGMICYNSTRPFSLDYKIDNLDSYLPSDSIVVEVRLLAVIQSERHGTVMYRLVKHLTKHLRLCGFNLAIISGTTRELDLYKKIGFVPFGPLVGKGTAQYQPMYVTLYDLKDDLKTD